MNKTKSADDNNGDDLGNVTIDMQPTIMPPTNNKRGTQQIRDRIRDEKA